MDLTRRKFMKRAALGSAGLALGGMVYPSGIYAKPRRGSDTINMAVVGVNNRGKELLRAILACSQANIGYICDVDSRAMENAIKMVRDRGGKKPKGIKDIRKLLEQKDLDAIAIATPEHWHAPMAIMGVQAGKHVYVEKPCSHNPREGEMLNEAQKKYDRIIQMGNQQRSAPTSIQAIREIREGIIGDPYYGKAWYSNNRKSIGRGNPAPVPGWLDWELWQGPAPRRAFKDNIVHYNWHWFWHWGTGETNNNGTHEIDICRWALGVDYPVRISSSGGRFHFDDDWEFCDTQLVNYEYAGGKTITWEGRSCNNFEVYNRGRGAVIHGTKGTVFLDRNVYILYNERNEVIKEVSEKELSATTDTAGGGSIDVYHMQNFLDAIRKGSRQHSPIHEGVITNNLCHLANIAQEVGRDLKIDPSNGKIQDDPEAMKWWSREYEKGWEPKV